MGEDRPSDDGAEPEPAQRPREAAEVSVVTDADPSPEGEAARAYHQRARLAEDRLAEVLGAYRKLKTDNEGHRERITRNLDRRYEQRRERLLLKFIDILDNLDRALEAAQISYAGEPLLEGMILVRTQLLQTLQDEGLERIPVVGLPFDPHLSESVGTQAVSEPEQDHVVVKEHMRGYRLNGRIARVSTVVIGVYEAPVGAAVEAPVAGPIPAVVGIPGPAGPPAAVSVPAPAEDREVIEIPADTEESPADVVLPEEATDEVEVLETHEMPAISDVPAIIDDASPPEPLPEEPAAETPLGEPALGEPSLEDIIARAEAQEALFPQVFNTPEPVKKSKAKKSED